MIKIHFQLGLSSESAGGTYNTPLDPTVRWAGIPTLLRPHSEMGRNTLSSHAPHTPVISAFGFSFFAPMQAPRSRYCWWYQQYLDLGACSTSFLQHFKIPATATGVT